MDLLARVFREMSPLEALAALLVLVNVWLITRRSIWNYAFGLAGVAIYGWVFFGEKLYSDTLLQAFFFVVQIYGWREWLRSQADEGEVRVERLTGTQRLAWLVAIVAAIASWGWLMHRFTDASFPWWDAAVAMTSVAAQILMSVRRIENWWLWITANVLSIGLYAAKALWITTGLYLVLLAIAIAGLVAWQRAARA